MCSLRNESELVTALLLTLCPIQNIVNFALKSIKIYRNCAPIFWMYVMYITSAFSSRQ